MAFDSLLGISFAARQAPPGGVAMARLREVRLRDFAGVPDASRRMKEAPADGNYARDAGGQLSAGASSAGTAGAWTATICRLYTQLED